MSILQTTYNYFHDKFKDLGSCYFAGGCVRDTLMNKTPKDYDFFILTGEGKIDAFETYKDTINKRLANFSIVNQLEFHKSEPYLITTIAVPIVIGYAPNSKITLYTPVERHLRVNEPCYIELQVLVNPASSIDILLDSFDWNTCMFSWGTDGFYNKEQIENIEEGKELKLNKVTFPLSTLRRGFRFSERFKMKLHPTVVTGLCQKIVDNAKSNNTKGPLGNEPDFSSLGNNILV